MNYLKITNAPVRGFFPELSNGRIDWEKAGFDKMQVRYNQAQGHIDASTFVSLFPVSDEAKLTEAGVVSKINESGIDGFSATIIDEATATSVKAEIEAYKASLQS